MIQRTKGQVLTPASWQTRPFVLWCRPSHKRPTASRRIWVGKACVRSLDSNRGRPSRQGQMPTSSTGQRIRCHSERCRFRPASDTRYPGMTCIPRSPNACFKESVSLSSYGFILEPQSSFTRRLDARNAYRACPRMTGTRECAPRLPAIRVCERVRSAIETQSKVDLVGRNLISPQQIECVFDLAG